MARKLYWGSGSSFCWRTQLVLEEKCLPYESILLSFSNKDHKSPEIMALNPRGQFPTFVDGENVINESGAACFYLETTYPSSGACLLPLDNASKAKIYQIAFESSNLHTPFAETFRYYMSSTRDGSLNKEELEAKVAKVKAELGIWEDKLKGKTFLVGEGFTLADVFLFPTLATIVRFGAQLSSAGFPALAAYYDLLSARELVQKTWPPHWKEGPCTSTFLASLS